MNWIENEESPLDFLYDFTINKNNYIRNISYIYYEINIIIKEKNIMDL